MEINNDTSCQMLLALRTLADRDAVQDVGNDSYVEYQRYKQRGRRVFFFVLHISLPILGGLP